MITCQCKMLLERFAKSLRSTNGLEGVRYLSNKSAYLTRIHRKLFLRVYPTVMVKPDGSTFTFRHYEPRKIIKLPLDITTLSEEEREIVLMNRKPKKKVVVQEEIEDRFDSKEYLKFFKKRASS